MVDVKTWQGQFDMSYVITGDTEDEVSAKAADVLRCYPSAGYGTSFRTPKQNSDGRWICEGYRYLSCD